jgi:signal transduction histidine kinase
MFGPAGRAYVSNLITGRVGRYVVFISLPVRVDGVWKYTLTYVTEPSAFAESLRATRVSPDLLIAIIDREGTIVARSPRGLQMVGRKAAADVVSAVTSGFEGVRESKSLEDYKLLAAFSRAPESGWTIAVGAQHDVIYAPARRLLWTGLGIALMLLGLAIAVSAWIARAVVRGIDTLVAGTQSIARGQAPHPRSSGLADTDFVAEAMQNMAREMRERTREDAALHDVVARVNRAAEMPEIYEAALDALTRGHGADRAAILIRDDKGTLRCKASRGLAPEFSLAIEGQSPWSPDEVRPAPLWFDDVATAAVSPAIRDAVKAAGMASFAYVPLSTKDKRLGKVILYYDRPHTFSAGELKPVETLASQIAFAIERQMAADALERLVDERTASLRKAVAQMEEFSYSVSHDLQAPLRAIRGYAEVLSEDHAGNWPAAPRELLGRIQRSSRRMEHMIQDLLSYTRVTRQNVQLERVSLARVFDEVRRQYPEAAPEQADIEFDTTLPAVIGSEALLIQAVSNLLANAVKFVRPGRRPEIHVGCDVRAGRARLWIRDNGIGIRPELQPRLFQMFERVHTEGTYEGTGIGLSIVRKAVERMNGTVGVVSDGMSGSTFWIELAAADFRTGESGLL